MIYLWHKDAVEASIETAEAQSGYLAPELLPKTKPKNASTRDPLVDSYGIGMTMYYMRTGQDPTFLQHRQAGWANLVDSLMGKYRCVQWRSLPRRFARLVVWCTLDDQQARPTLPQIQAELDRMVESIVSPAEVRHADMLCEELACRTSASEAIWGEADASASIPLQQGVSIKLRGDDTLGQIELSLGWQDTGDLERAKRRQWILGRLSAIRGILKSAGWIIVDSSAADAEYSLRATIQCMRVRLELDRHAEILGKCVAKIGEN